ncbi:hypothetical protein JL475_24360 [Streptomyces sp. M2CJ-2]|uniref:hypothetical protein n=1 Tax=Streptomyces sp. M2CJ-2 TaxID=2803948 RepID=UPI001929596A|nr:hypothetical protein [Streptomyces sp. M2CJ-2]MBL3669069.1 hypothetical protein [Streptomyces sp. M2CJ-2]
MSAPTTMQWIRQAGQRISTGSGRLAVHLAAQAIDRGRRIWRRATGWLGEASGISWLLRLAVLLAAAAILRKIVTAVAIGVYVRIDSGAAPWLMWGAAGVWVVAAYRCGQDDWEPKKPATDAPQPADGHPAEAAEEQPEPAAEPPLPILPNLRTSLARVGTPHAHIAALAADIGTTPERVREALEKWQVPVEPVRMKGRGTSTGVKGGSAVHPALAPRPEDAAVVAAGQATNNDNNNAEEPTTEKGVRVERTQTGGYRIFDLADAHRHHRVDQS